MLWTRFVHPRSELPVAGCERDHVLSGALAVRFHTRGRPLAGMKPGGMSARDANAASMRPAVSVRLPHGLSGSVALAGNRLESISEILGVAFVSDEKGLEMMHS